MENEIVLETGENINLNGIKNDSPKINSSEVTEVLSKITPDSLTLTPPECEIVKAGNSNVQQSTIRGNVNPKFLNSDGNQVKIKRKRRRGKPKGNSKPFKKSNWKFQMPQRYRNGGSGNGPPLARPNLARSNSIVPYNTNKFLMEEHMDEVPNDLITPSGRTRDSSFSVDSEDNYFFSLPEDEEEFLTKEFSNVYERARIERLETMNKQQLIEECLQIEDRYSQFDVKQQQRYSTEFLNKIRFLEERVRELNKENLELRRKVDNVTVNSATTSQINNSKPEPMCGSDCSSEDSESDSSSSSSSSSTHSSSVSEYSVPYSPTENGQIDENSPYSQHNGNNCHEPTLNASTE